MKRFIFLLSLLALVGCNQPYLFYDSSQSSPKVDLISVKEIVAMTKAGVSEEIILAKVKESQLRRRLDKKDIKKMRKVGVSEKVIATLKKRQPEKRRRQYQRYYYYYHYPSGYYRHGNHWDCPDYNHRRYYHRSRYRKSYYRCW